MPAPLNKSFVRRDFLVSAALAAAALPGFAATAARAAEPADPAGEPVRRLVTLAARNAFATLTQPNGFWNSRVARFGLPVLFRKTAANAASPLGSDDFRWNLQHRLNNFAEAGARGALPVVAQEAAKMTVADPAAVLRGIPTSATSLLRLDMAAALVNAMISPLEQALTAAQDPLVAQAQAALPGVRMVDIAHAVALAADHGIWYEIGSAEVKLRANPEATGDPALVAALRGA